MGRNQAYICPVTSVTLPVNGDTKSGRQREGPPCARGGETGAGRPPGR